MNIEKVYNQTQKLSGLYKNWEKQGLTEKQKKIRLKAFLDEAKRRNLRENE